MKQTLRGPNGIRIELDSSEIFPNDPGAGTPAMVYACGKSATFWCALDTGVLDDDRELDPYQAAWLERQEDAVNAFIEEHTP